MAGDFRKQGDGRGEAAEVRGWQIGKPHRKLDSVDRMVGVARYTDDLKLPGMLHGKILRSPHAHARIRSIDASRALAMPGVHAVVTGKDFPIPYGVIPWTPDENALGVDKVCYVGDGVAAVAAVDEDTAIEALAAIEVDYEVLPAVFDPEEALARTDITVNPYGKKGNLSKHVELSFGDVDAGLAAADLVIEDEYFFEGTTHTAIEPHCAVARVESSGVLTVWSATQVSHYLHRELSKVLEMPPSRIRVIQPPLGGAFGGKSEPFDLEFCVAKLAMLTGRPVKILYTREEVFYSHRGRHPMKMRYRTGLTPRRHASPRSTARTIIDGGAYSSFGLVTTYYSGQLLCAPYRFGAYKFDSWRAYTNKPACGPKRGHGSVQPRFAIECQLDKAAGGPGHRSHRAAAQERPRRQHRARSTSSASAPTASSSAWPGSRPAAAGRTATASCPTAAAWASPGRPTSAAPTTASTPTRCRRPRSRSPSTAAAGRGSSPAPTTSARAPTPCWR